MPTKYSVEDAPTKSKYSVEDTTPPPATSPAADQGSWWDRVTAPYTEIQKPDPNHPWNPSEAVKAVGNIGAGGLGVLLHPINTLEGIGGMVTAVPEMMAGKKFSETVPGQMVQSIRENPYGAIEAGIGQAGATPLAEGAVRAAARPITAMPAIMKTGARILSNTTPRIAEELATDTAAANEAALAKNAKTQAEAQAARQAQLEKHGQKVSQVRQENEAAQAVQSRKEALQRGVEQLDPKFQEDLKATERSVRAQGNEKYNTVRKALGPEIDAEGKPIEGTAPTVPGSDLASAVKAAEEKIQGSSESLKVFRDILSKHPETEPNTVEYQGAQIPKGHPLYDVLTEGAEGAAPANFADLQGYYSELGEKLASGGLPGDVYQATKALQESIGGMMKKLADSRGVGPQLADAQNYWRQYMQDFRESSSPLNKAMKAPEPGHPTKGAIAKLQGMDKSGIEALARHNPDLAQRANTIRGYQAEAKSITGKPPTPKAEPALPPKPAPKLEEIKKIGLQDISEAKKAAIEDQVRFLRRRISFLSGGYGAYHLLHSIVTGNLTGVATGGALIAMPYVLAEALESPKIVRVLTKPTPADIAQIPPELRGDLPTIIEAAKQKGLKVHPAILAMAAQKPNAQQ